MGHHAITTAVQPFFSCGLPLTNVQFASFTFLWCMPMSADRLPPLDLLAAFEAVARRGSIHGRSW